MRETIAVWEFDREIGVELATRAALDQLEPPDLEVVLLATRGDAITVQVVEGSVSDSDSVLYVAGRGLYEVLRSEAWPPVEPEGPPRVLLTLKSWPGA
jgi:hypothetical protein